MKKFYIAGLMLVALFALGNAATASALICLLNDTKALATTEKYLTTEDCELMVNANAEGEWVLMWEWLVDEARITELLSTETIGELTLKVENVPVLGTVEVLCSGILDGTISPEGMDEVTEVLTLAGVNGPILCINILNCPTPLAVAVGLPYTTELGAAVEGKSLSDETSAAEVGYEVTCMGIIGEPKEKCTQPKVISTLENMGAPDNDVLVTINEEKTGNCHNAGANEGSIKTDEPSLLQVLEGLSLAVS